MRLDGLQGRLLSTAQQDSYFPEVLDGTRIGCEPQRSPDAVPCLLDEGQINFKFDFVVQTSLMPALGGRIKIRIEGGRSLEIQPRLPMNDHDLRPLRIPTELELKSRRSSTRGGSRKSEARMASRSSLNSRYVTRDIKSEP
ncbi:hypothetical protein DOTSEDRAFT_69586 [Dothistroma septosporum NZE10]|uniref:Uncharacterized protein n=1 Tax=Dothistroma septosporum (strain NZE10 / CBS 128990) TaxID=675120 RepID=N1PWB6_DOTSN|nr:hypothetical protein DOTSEDRAFT_69586 [Dothistroma septosporum NZE10]